MKLSEIINDLTPLEVLGDPTNCEITDITFDSRKASAGSLFVAQKGVATDGHNFIPQVLAAGCNAILCESLPENPSPSAVIVRVADTHLALGLVASAFFGYPSRKLTLVGVTGTNGKTTIATLLHHLLTRLGHKSGLFSTVANYIGDEKVTATHTTPDAVTLNREMRKMVDEGCEYCFMEVSSHSVVQHRIAGLDFDGGIFTNITHDHLDYHKTFDAYIKAKKGFFDGLKKDAFALTNIDDKNGMVMLQNTAATKRTYSVRSMADYKGTLIDLSFDGMQMKFNGEEAFMQFVGLFNASNLLAIFGAAVSLGFEPHDVIVALSALSPVDGRFETFRSPDGKIAIVDYAHTPDALKNVLSTINEIRKDGQKLFCVVGCGGDRDRTKRPEMAHEAIIASDMLILTSDNPRTEKPEDILAEMKAGLTIEEVGRSLTIADRREAIRTAIMLAKPSDIILIAGKGHEPYQEINGVRHHFDDREEVRNAFNK